MKIVDAPSSRYEVFGDDGRYPPLMTVEGTNREVHIIPDVYPESVIPQHLVKPLHEILGKLIVAHNYK